jgi:hypothetical protein
MNELMIESFIFRICSIGSIYRIIFQWEGEVVIDP